MVGDDLTRRKVLAALAALTALPQTALADEVIDLEWQDLLPKGQTMVPNSFQGFIQHDDPSFRSEQPASTGVRTEWNGQIVRLPGFMVPIDYDGTGVTAFLLVPFVGACVHVPPPPANQLVFVTTEEPYEAAGLFEPINVTGMFGAASTHTQLAEVGYAMSAELIEPYG